MIGYGKSGIFKFQALHEISKIVDTFAKYTLLEPGT